MEIWRDIPGYESFYQISNEGKIKSFYRNPPLLRRPEMNKYGYLQLILTKNKTRKVFTVHRLVMMAFVGMSDLVIDHIDGNKLNNRVSNLRYVTQRDNVIYSVQRKKKISKFIGVWKAPKSKKWRAQIKIKGRKVHLGAFHDEKSAAEAYQKAYKSAMEL